MPYGRPCRGYRYERTVTARTVLRSLGLRAGRSTKSSAGVRRNRKRLIDDGRGVAAWVTNYIDQLDARSSLSFGVS